MTKIFSEGLDEFIVIDKTGIVLIKGTMHEVILYVTGAWEMRKMALRVVKEMNTAVKAALDSKVI